MNPIMWMHQICNNYFIGKATALGRLSKSRPEEVRHAYLTKYSMLCVCGRSHGCCVIAGFLQSLNEALSNLSCTIWNKNMVLTIHFSTMAEYLWRPRCQMWDQTPFLWSHLPAGPLTPGGNHCSNCLTSNIKQQSVICYWHVMSA